MSDSPPPPAPPPPPTSPPPPPSEAAAVPEAPKPVRPRRKRGVTVQFEEPGGGAETRAASGNRLAALRADEGARREGPLRSADRPAPRQSALVRTGSPPPPAPPSPSQPPAAGESRAVEVAEIAVAETAADEPEDTKDGDDGGAARGAASPTYLTVPSAAAVPSDGASGSEGAADGASRPRTETDMPLNRRARGRGMTVYKHRSWRWSSFRRYRGVARLSYWGCILNTTNSVVSVGLLQMAYVYRSWGLIPGTLLILLFGYMCDLSVKLLCKTATRTSSYSYESIAGFFYGNRGDALTLAWLTLTTFGMCVAQVIVVSDALVPLAVHWNGGRTGFGTSPFLVTSLVVALLILPSCLRHRLRHLTYVSAASLTLVFGFLVAVVVRTAQRLGYYVGGDWPVFHAEQRGLATLPVLTVAFTMHYNVFPLFQELKRPTMHRVKHAVRSSVVFACFAYVFTGFFGYVAFSRHTRSNVLSNYRADDVIVGAMRFLLAGSAALSFPLVHHPCRLYFDLFLDRVWWKGQCSMIQSRRFIFHTLILLAATMIVGLTARSLFTVSAVVGTFFALPLCFIFPPVFYLLAHRRGGWHRKLIFPVALLATSSLFFILSVAGLAIYAVKGDGHV